MRRQIPLKLGWAATIHKTQGMSITQLVYDMSDTFAAGMGYVALSRVVSLQGLYLKGYSPNVICRDERIIRAEYGWKILNITYIHTNILINEKSETSPEN